MGCPKLYPGSSRWCGQLLDAAATMQTPLPAVDWAGLENSCKMKAHTSTKVDYWCLLLVCLCFCCSALHLEQKADLTGVQSLLVSCFSGVIIFIYDALCSLLSVLPGTA